MILAVWYGFNQSSLGGSYEGSSIINQCEREGVGLCQEVTFGGSFRRSMDAGQLIGQRLLGNKPSGELRAQQGQQLEHFLVTWAELCCTTRHRAQTQGRLEKEPVIPTTGNALIQPAPRSVGFLGLRESYSWGH